MMIIKTKKNMAYMCTNKIWVTKIDRENRSKNYEWYTISLYSTLNLN